MEVLAQADLVLALDVKDLYGATHPLRGVLPEAARVIQISLWDQMARGWSADYQRMLPVDLNIAADTSVALPQLVEACREMLTETGTLESQYKERHASCSELHNRLRQGWSAKTRETAQESPISLAKLAADVWECIKDEDWALVAGVLQGWARRIWEFDKRYQYLGHSGGAGLGYVAGAAIGAALAYKDTGRLSVCLQSDGDLLYTPSALWTAAHHRVPLLMVMFNNRTYYNSEEHAIRVAQQRERPVENAGVGTSLREPDVDFAALACSMGVYGEGPVERPEEIIPAVKRAIKVVKELHAPALVDVVCQPR